MQSREEPLSPPKAISQCTEPETDMHRLSSTSPPAPGLAPAATAPLEAGDPACCGARPRWPGCTRPVSDARVGRRRAERWAGPGRSTMEGGAYGAGKAGGAFDPQTLLRQPHTVLRFVSWVRLRRDRGAARRGGAPRIPRALPAHPKIAHPHPQAASLCTSRISCRWWVRWEGPPQNTHTCTHPASLSPAGCGRSGGARGTLLLCSAPPIPKDAPGSGALPPNPAPLLPDRVTLGVEPPCSISPRGEKG